MGGVGFLLENMHISFDTFVGMKCKLIKMPFSCGKWLTQEYSEKNALKYNNYFIISPQQYNRSVSNSVKRVYSENRANFICKGHGKRHK